MAQPGQEIERRQIVKSSGKMPRFCLWQCAARDDVPPFVAASASDRARAPPVRWPALAADAFSTDWATGAKSEARLVAAGGELAGFEIRLAPGAITYWRDPGRCRRAADLRFRRLRQCRQGRAGLSGAEADQGIRRRRGVRLRRRRRLPVEASSRAIRRSRSRSTLHANFAVCEKICLPAKARLTLTLPGRGVALRGPGRGGARRGAARGRSRRISASSSATAPTAGGSARPHEAGPARDLFVEPPEGWWVTAAPAPGEAGHDCFRLSAARASRRTPRCRSRCG